MFISLEVEGSDKSLKSMFPFLTVCLNITDSRFLFFSEMPLALDSNVVSCFRVAVMGKIFSSWRTQGIVQPKMYILRFTHPHVITFEELWVWNDISVSKHWKNKKKKKSEITCMRDPIFLTYVINSHKFRPKHTPKLFQGKNSPSHSPGRPVHWHPSSYCNLIGRGSGHYLINWTSFSLFLGLSVCFRFF